MDFGVASPLWDDVTLPDLTLENQEGGVLTPGGSQQSAQNRRQERAIRGAAGIGSLLNNQYQVMFTGASFLLRFAVINAITNYV